MAHTLGLRRLQDFLQGTTTLPTSSEALWLLGMRYQNPAQDSPDTDGSRPLDLQVLDEVLADFASCIWMTYRRDFPPIGDTGLTSDVGWGCTLRSGQMLLAQALLRHVAGRAWRRRLGGEPLLEAAPAVAALLAWFWDRPDVDAHPFSIHSLCEAGRAHGVVPGHWLGPSTLCHTLEALCRRRRPAGLRMRVVASAGGGAPVLATAEIEAEFDAAPAPALGDAAPAPAPAETSAEASRAGPVSAASGVTSAGGAGVGPGAVDGAKALAELAHQPPGLLLLVPLMLGLQKLNPRYCEQLRALLSWPQSCGVLGGRPSSSLLFVGAQAGHVLFMDPHEVQEAGGEQELDTYFCGVLRMMPLANIDPSLAIAFYCRTREEFRDLAARLAALEAAASGAPLLSVAERAPCDEVAAWRGGDLADAGGEEWEVL
ncbi:hypothetical protein WJX81_001612 [Elliptochloris bilobata]|uniref:Cysteine protease n=1 Tax=Elliptochloris bilobata TaxID=381761 RepID=A0AAW1RAU9_9CHLO